MLFGKRKHKIKIGPGGAPLCARCGYELAGIADDSVCPECGASVWLSRYGTALPESAEGSLRLLARGSSQLMWSMILVGVAPILMMAFALIVATLMHQVQFGDIFEHAVTALLAVMSVTAVVLWVLGWGLVTRACGDDQLAGTSPLTRRMTTIGAWGLGCVTAVTIVFIVAEAVGVPGLDAPLLIGVVLAAGALCFSVGGCTGMLLARAVLERTSARAAKRRADSLVWLSPAAFVAMVPAVSMSGMMGGWPMQLYGCASLIAWAWLVFGASVMMLLGREARWALELKRRHG